MLKIKHEREKANGVKCQQLGKVGEGYVGVPCTVLAFLLYLFFCSSENFKNKKVGNKKIKLNSNEIFV